MITLEPFRHPAQLLHVSPSMIDSPNLVEPALHLCNGLIHFLARPFLLAVFGKR
jgi:hypothetical protein